MATPTQYDAFLREYNAYYDKILTYVYYRTGQDRALAEDLTQEIFVKALERFDTYDPSRAFQAWLYTIARNHLTDFYRKRREVVSYETLENVLTVDEDPAAALDRSALLERIFASLPLLTEDEQELITLRFVQELTTEEIAEIVGKKPNAIYVGIHRALKKLRTLVPDPSPNDDHAPES